MKTKLVALILAGFALSKVDAQLPAAAASSGSAMAVSRAEATPVNGYTGIPSIGFPLVNYSHPRGLSLSIGISYFGGGIKTEEPPNSFGAGWSMTGAGAITRMIRGIPDDCPGRGFLYKPTLPSYSRDSIGRFANGMIDGEQDVFQFQFPGHSGKFYIGKDSQAVITPASKMTVQLFFSTIDSLGIYQLFCNLDHFIITAEDGTRYYFSEKETQKMSSPIQDTAELSTDIIYTEVQYTSAWYLSKIESFNKADSITFQYISSNSNVQPPWHQQFKHSGVHTDFHSDTTDYPSPIASQVKILSEIDLPDNKKINFTYNQAGQFLFNSYPLIRRVKFSDPDFLYGYMFTWDTTTAGKKLTNRNFLRRIDWYNSNAKRTGFEFSYYDSLPSVTAYGTSSYANSKDHWGYYNGAWNHKEYIPTIPGTYTGADRTPNILAVAGTLKSVKDALGGTTYYDFENNTMYPYRDSINNFTFDPSSLSSHTVTINRLIGPKTFFLLKGTIGAASGSEKVRFYVQNTGGTTTYFSDTIDLASPNLFGLAKTGFVVPSGSYLIKIAPVSGYTVASRTLTAFWVTQVQTSGDSVISAGIRIKRIRHYDPFSAKTDTLSTYQYKREDGKSSGTLGAPPNYKYTLTGGGVGIQSSVRDDIDYSEGTTVGYSRVTVIKGSEARNLGKEVIEYTTVDDNDFDNSLPFYPFTPKQNRSYTEGLEKRKSVYDSSGRLVKSTTNTYSFTDISPTGDNYCSFRSGSINTALFTDFSSTSLFLGSQYHPVCGIAQLTASVDTVFHPDTSITVTQQAMEYDTNYNLVKITSPYDLNRGLSLEKRIYYPYNYTASSVTLNMLRKHRIFVPVSTESWITGDAYPRMIANNVTGFVNHEESEELDPLFAVLPEYTYSLETKAPLSQSYIGTFDPSVLVRNDTVIKAQQRINYTNDIPSQVTNVQSGISQVTLYGYTDHKPVAKIANASPRDVAYAGFEDNTFGNWTHTGTGFFTYPSAITGNNAGYLVSDTLTKSSLTSGKKYLVSYWGGSGINVSGSGSTQLIEQRGSWNLYNKIVTGVTSIQITGSGLIDELRLCPVEASMTTTSYNAMGQPVSVSDMNNNIQYYEYDSVYRVAVIRDKDKNVIKKYSYSDPFTHISLAPDPQTSLDSNLWICGDTGHVYHAVIDMNPNSETYLVITSYGYDHTDLHRCPVECPDVPWRKLIDGVCEYGCKVTTGCYEIRGEWTCVYYYEFSDHSRSDEIEEACVSCEIGTDCDWYL